MNSYSSYIHLSRYALWDESRKRRETWQETVDRYIGFFKKRFADYPADEVRKSHLSNGSDAQHEMSDDSGESIRKR